MAFDGRSFLLSTYQEDFANKETLPSLVNFQSPCFYESQGKLSPRCFPISQPRSPGRKRDSDIPIALGFNTLIHRLISLDESCDGVQTRKERFKDLSNGTTSKTTGGIPSLIIEELVKLGTYTPSSHMTMLPPSSPSSPKKILIDDKRSNLDHMVQCKSKVQEKPERWQKIGCIWDKLQDRKVVGTSESTNPIIKNENVKTRLLNRSRVGVSTNTTDNSSESNQFYSNIPGYGGYQPCLPNSTRMSRLPNNSTNVKLRTTSNVTYRKHAQISYRLPQYGHNGLMSRTVTLTEPFNPFNKVIKQISVI